MRKVYELSPNVREFKAIADIDLDPDEIIYGLIQAKILTDMEGYSLDRRDDILTINNVVPIISLRLKG